jgi:hypothetical protein
MNILDPSNTTYHARDESEKHHSLAEMFRKIDYRVDLPMWICSYIYLCKPPQQNG